jgi:hypothetical protein
MMASHPPRGPPPSNVDMSTHPQVDLWITLSGDQSRKAPITMTMNPPRDAGPLRQQLLDAAGEYGLPMKDLTVLAAQNDPYRVDTPAGHRDGAWLAITARELGLGERTIHLRGLHYMILGRPKPNGRPYSNTDEDWKWLQNEAGKSARWLGYIPFDQITDKRNATPTVRRFEYPAPFGYIDVGIDVEIPDVEEIVPKMEVYDFAGVQPYKLVMVGEKSSLDEVLAPVAERRQADLYLPTGEISDTLIYSMAKVGAEDGRPMIVLYFADADPAGWQMGISVGRKLQAFKALHFDGLEFEVRRVALTPDQVREYGLPSTPLKVTEKRSDPWRAAMGTEQTEIDALAALQPRLLQQLAEAAIRPFFDRTLEGRVREARRAWLAAAQDALDDQLDEEHLSRIRAEAEEKLPSIRQELDALNAALRVDASDFDLPELEVPDAVIPARPSDRPLVDSAWPFAMQCDYLIRSKSYQNGDGE